jgi:hypothetical protein
MLNLKFIIITKYPDYMYISNTFSFTIINIDKLKEAPIDQSN